MKKGIKQNETRKKRKAVKWRAAVAVSGVVFTAGLLGCGQAPRVDSPETLSSEPFPSTVSKEEKKEDREETPEDANLLWQRAGMSGTVMEFTEEGCSISLTESEGNLAWGAAEGYESEEEISQVLYSEDCVFWIANVDIITAKASYESASREDVKKQTSVILYGDYDGEGQFKASRVYIYRGTEG